MLLLTLIRHAKSSWSDTSLNDFDRPLNKRGKRDAPMMGKLLTYLEFKPDLVICSAAKRAQTTWQLLSSEIRQSNDLESKTEKNLYMASAEKLIALISQQPKTCQHLSLIGHNPGLTDLANSLSDGRLDNLATCGMVQIRFDAKCWTDAVNESGCLQTYISPKSLTLFR